jgi:hypothetical protein
MSSGGGLMTVDVSLSGEDFVGRFRVPPPPSFYPMMDGQALPDCSESGCKIERGDG